MTSSMAEDPQLRLAKHQREFGENGGVNASIEVSTTFTTLDPSTMSKIFSGVVGPAQGCYLYGRSFNPTVRALSRQLAALENTESAYCAASGMAAISSSLLALCNTGDHIVASNTVYGGTFALLKTFFPTKMGITTTFVDITDAEAVEAAITDSTKVIYTESMSNPTLVVADVPRLASLAHGRGLKLVVDNTFCPFVMTPANWGADVVIHSMTKYISGASDIIAGAACGSAAFVQSLMDLHCGPLMLLGATMDPKVASELSLRLPHLALRMQEHSRRALYMAERLQRIGARVVYPGLHSHPQHELLAQLVNPGYGFGGILGIDMDTPSVANDFMQRLQNKHSFGFIAVSLGYFDTLMSLSGSSTSSELSESDKAASHISAGYVRMSIGVTGTLEQRWHQLQESYLFVKRVGDQAPYRAVIMKQEEDGHVKPVMSWPSDGSPLCSGSGATCVDAAFDEVDSGAVDGLLLAGPGVDEGGNANGGNGGGRDGSVVGPQGRRGGAEGTPAEEAVGEGSGRPAKRLMLLDGSGVDAVAGPPLQHLHKHVHRKVTPLDRKAASRAGEVAAAAVLGDSAVQVVYQPNPSVVSPPSEGGAAPEAASGGEAA